MNKHSRIMVTGSRGMLGRHLCDKLKAKGYEDIREIYGTDLRKPKEVTELFRVIGPEYVFHCAAKVAGIGGNARKPADMLVDNVLINTNVVGCASLSKVKKILCMGSGAIYPVGEQQFKEDEVWNGPPHPSEASYAHAKRLMLAHLEAEKLQNELSYAYVISSNLYGSYDKFNPDTGHVIPSLIAKFHEAKRKGGVVNAWGTGRAVRDFMYVEDAAEALIEIMLSCDGSINMASGSVVSIGQIVELLKVLYPNVYVEWNATQPDGQSIRTYDLKRLEEIFSTKTRLCDGLKLTKEWYEANVGSART